MKNEVECLIKLMPYSMFDVLKLLTFFLPLVGVREKYYTTHKISACTICKNY